MQRRWFFSSLLLLLLSQFALSLDVNFINSLKQRLRARHEIADLDDSTEASVEELFLFTDSEVEATGARCLDGSNYGFYFRPGTGSGQTKWMMSLQGGGYCLPNPPSENIDDCHERIKTKLGTSTVWKTTKKVGELHSTNPSKNPDFYNWNVVTLPYCSGDVHSGTRRSQVEGFFFSGHLNFMASIKKLWSFGLGNATEVFLGGVSAGGVGTFINTDWLLSALPATAQLRAIPNAGWFLPVPPYSSEVAPITEGMKQIVQLGASYVNQQCAAAYPNETFICLSANHSYPFMPVPTFVAEHIYDSDELLVENGVPNEPNNPKVLAYVAEYGKLTVQTLQQVVANQRDGLFVPSCLEHDVYWNEELVQGQTWQQTTSFWYHSSSAGKTKVVDNCSGIACNPTCPDDQTYKLKNVNLSV